MSKTMILAATLLSVQVVSAGVPGVMLAQADVSKKLAPRFEYVDDDNMQFKGTRFYEQAPELMTMKKFREQIPQLHGLDDASAVRVIQKSYYPTVSVEQIALKLGIVMPPPFVPKDLGPIDKWRYQSCQQDAALAPTSQGVGIRMRVCRQKFGQQASAQ
jgi:hypothetical protein